MMTLTPDVRRLLAALRSGLAVLDDEARQHARFGVWPLHCVERDQLGAEFPAADGGAHVAAVVAAHKLAVRIVRQQASCCAPSIERDASRISLHTSGSTTVEPPGFFGQAW